MSRREREWLSMLAMVVWVVVGLTLVQECKQDYHHVGASLISVTGVAVYYGMLRLLRKWERREDHDPEG